MDVTLCKRCKYTYTTYLVNIIYIVYYVHTIVSIYIYSSKHTLIRWCAAGSYAETAGRAVPTSTLTDRKIILLN